MGLFGFLFSLFYEPPRRSSLYRTSRLQPAAFTTKAQSDREIRNALPNLPTARVKWILDGDSVLVVMNRQEKIVRLDSIDCPEEGQNWGDTAKYGLIKLIGKKHISLEIHGMDSHGRTLATAYLWNDSAKEWLNVNERMVILGHAWVMQQFYDHLPPDRQFKLNKLEEWARSKNIGLWSTPYPIPPWRFRKDSRNS